MGNKTFYGDGLWIKVYPFMEKIIGIVHVTKGNNGGGLVVYIDQLKFFPA